MGGVWMLTGQQVRRLRQKLMQGKTQEAAAAAAGMSVRSAPQLAARAIILGREDVAGLADPARFLRLDLE